MIKICENFKTDDNDDNDDVVACFQIDDIHLVPDRDYIVVRDGDHPKSPLLGSLTGAKHDNPKLMMSTGNNLYLYLKTSLGETKKGFKFKYSQGKYRSIHDYRARLYCIQVGELFYRKTHSLGCRVTVSEVNGTLSSPSFGLGYYPSNLDCLIRIRNPSLSPLSLKFDSMNIHPSDVVQIYDGGSTSGLRLHPNEGFTGNVVPKITVTASSGEMLVRFITDALHNSRGWRATFSAGKRIFSSRNIYRGTNFRRASRQ